MIPAPRRRQPSDDFALHCKARKLPIPMPEWQFHPTRKWRFDWAWPQTGLRLAMEVDGGAWKNGRHSRGVGKRNDCEKEAAALALGWRVLHVMPEHVKSGQAADWVQKILEAR